MEIAPQSEDMELILTAGQKEGLTFLALVRMTSSLMSRNIVAVIQWFCERSHIP